MIPETIAEIEARVRRADSLTEQSKADLLALLTSLKDEVGELAKTEGEAARSIASHAKASADEATRGPADPELLQGSLDRLAASVSKFEETHPKLVEVVNRIATMLASFGI